MHILSCGVESFRSNYIFFFLTEDKPTIYNKILFKFSSLISDKLHKIARKHFDQFS